MTLTSIKTRGNDEKLREQLNYDVHHVMHHDILASMFHGRDTLWDSLQKNVNSSSL